MANAPKAPVKMTLERSIDDLDPETYGTRSFNFRVEFEKY